MVGAEFGRSFFYIGIPPAHLFIGEIILCLFLVVRADRSLGTWGRTLIGPSDYSFFSWCLLLSCLYGGFEVLYGLHRDYDLLTAIENFAFNVYPIYFFLGIWVGEQYNGTVSSCRTPIAEVFCNFPINLPLTHGNQLMQGWR
jgi:hypothetical protein